MPRRSRDELSSPLLRAEEARGRRSINTPGRGSRSKSRSRSRQSRRRYSSDSDSVVNDEIVDLLLPNALKSGGGSRACGRGCCKNRSCSQITLIVLGVIVVILGAAIGAVYGTAHSYAQDTVNNSILKFNAFEINTDDVDPLECHAAALHLCFRMGVTAQFDKKGWMPTTLASTSVAVQTSVSGRKLPFGSVTLPEIHVGFGDDSTTFTFSSVVSLENQDVFTTFANSLVYGEGADLQLTGEVDLTSWVLFLPVHESGITFDKTVSLEGSQGFETPALTPLVSGFSMSDSDSDTVRVNATVRVYNPGTLTLAPLGGMGMTISYNDVDVATVSANSLHINAKGWTDLQMTGTFNAVADGPAKDTQIELINKFWGGTASPVKLAAYTTDATPFLFKNIVSKLDLSATMEPSPFTFLDTIKVDGMGLAAIPNPSVISDSFTGDALMLDLNATIAVRNPLGPASPLTFSSFNFSMDMTGDGNHMGHVELDNVKPTLIGRSIPAGFGDGYTPYAVETLTMRIKAPLLIGQETSFEAFLASYLGETTASVEFGGTGSSLGVIFASALGKDLHVNIPLAPITAMTPGFNGFSGVNVSNFKITGAAPSGTSPAPLPGHGITAGAMAHSFTAVINSPAKASLNLGKTLNVDILGPGGVVIGSASATDVILSPGSNSVAFTGVIDPITAETQRQSVSAFITSYLTGTPTPITVQGSSVVMPGGGAPPAWLAAEVKDLTIETSIPPAPTSLWSGFGLQQMNVDFTKSSTTLPVFGALTTKVTLPFTTPSIAFGGYNMSFSLLSSDNGNVIASTTVTNGLTEYDGSAGTAVIYMPPGSLTVAKADEFSAFVKNVYTLSSYGMDVQMVVEQQVFLPIGPVKITKYSMTESVPFKGMGALSNPAPVFTQLEPTTVSSADFHLTHKIKITNPSPFEGNFGAVSAFTLSNNGTEVLAGQVPSMVLKTGDNYVDGVGVITPNIKLPVVFGNYFGGQSTSVDFLSGASATTLPLLEPTLNSLKLSATVGGVEHGGFIHKATVDVLTWDFFDNKANITITGNNPFTTQLRVVKSALAVDVCGLQSGDKTCFQESYPLNIGEFSPYLSLDDDWVLTSNSTSQSKIITLKTVIDKFSKGFDTFLDMLLHGYAPTRFHGSFTMLVGKWVQPVTYNQIEVQLYSKFGAKTMRALTATHAVHGQGSVVAKRGLRSAGAGRQVNTVSVEVPHAVRQAAGSLLAAGEMELHKLSTDGRAAAKVVMEHVWNNGPLVVEGEV